MHVAYPLVLLTIACMMLAVYEYFQTINQEAAA
jgi:hypothetical protein